MSKVSREQAAENRSKVVAVASSLFRRRGFDGVGIDDLMAEAGLTRGAFYGQFGSKDALAAEACDHAFNAAALTWAKILGEEPGARLRRLTEFYFERRGDGCPMATLAGDAARAVEGGPVRRAFTAGLRRLANVIGGDGDDDRALAVMAAMVGAAALRRASEDSALSDSIDAAVRRLAGA